MTDKEQKSKDSVCKVNNETFVFYKEIFEAIEEIPDKETKVEAYNAIVLYGLFDVEPDESANAYIKIIFKLAKPLLDGLYT